MADSTDWKSLGYVDFENMEDIWNYSRLGATTAGESGLIILQAIPEVHMFLKFSAMDLRAGDRKARKVTRRLKSVVNHFSAIKNDFEKIPADVTAAFNDEITAARSKNTKRIDWSK